MRRCVIMFGGCLAIFSALGACGGDEVDPVDVQDTAAPEVLFPDTFIVDTVAPLDTVAPPDAAPPDAAPPDAEPADADAAPPGDTAAPGDTGAPGDVVDPPLLVDHCRLERPLEVTLGAATQVNVFGRVRVDGLTDATTGNDAHPDLRARVGRGPVGSAPETWTVWANAAANPSYSGATSGDPDHDEYVGTLGAVGAPGVYDVAFAFSRDAGATWTWCDRDAGPGADGSEDGYTSQHAGKLTVVPNPCAPNPCTSPPSGCDGGTLEIYGTPGACTDSAGAADCDYTLASVTNCVAQGDACDAATLSCVDGVCDPNPCTAAPPATCDGDEKVTYGSPGVCDDATGTAVCGAYPEASRVTCAAPTPFCERGDCRAWRLADPGDLVISELMFDPTAVDDVLGEWFELRSVAADPVNLWGLTFSDDGTDSFVVGEDVVVAPGGYVVLGRNGDAGTNGGVAVDYAYGSAMTLNNTTPDALRIARAGAEVDAVSWGAGWPRVAGRAMNLDSGVVAAAGNDGPGAWCAAFAQYNGQDYGTPGAANGACAASWDVGWCRLQFPATVALAPGEPAPVRGRVFIDGLTDVDDDGNDPHPAVVGAVGYGPAGTLPATSGAWVWSEGAPAADYVVTGNPLPEPDNDEYLATLTAPAAAGTYDFAFRFSGDGGATWLTCDLNGVTATGSEPYEPEQAGELTVAAAPSGVTLFISQYIEAGTGEGNTKAIELFNHGDAPVDLAAEACALRVYTNASLTPGGAAELSGTIPPRGAWTLCHAQHGGLSPCDATSTSNGVNFNGNDSVELSCDGVVIDFLGDLGSDANFAVDVTLHRACGTTVGNPSTAAFDPAAWDAHPTNTYGGLGEYRPIIHDVDGGQEVVIEAVDLTTRRMVLRNVSANPVTITSAWRVCSFPDYAAFTSSDVVISPNGGTATFDLPSLIPSSPTAAFELAIYRDGNFGSSGSVAAYVAVNGAGFTRESVAVTAGVWTAGHQIDLTSAHSGFTVKPQVVATTAAAYEPLTPLCSVR